MGGSLKLWRSAWGLGGLRATPGQTLSRVRAAGFDGLECSLRDLGDTQDKRAALVVAVRDEGLALGLSAYSSWPDYEGPADEQLGKSADEHLAALTHELEQIAELCARAGRLSPIERINVHSGSDAWGEDSSVDFLARAVAATSQLGGLPPASHETHRGRILCCPFITARVLGRVPGLRLTSDFSHWVVKTERMLDTAAEAELLRRVVAPAVDHVHARIGTPQSPQVASVRPDALTRAAAERFYLWWEDVWAAQLAGSPGDCCTATIEYGPPELHPDTGGVLPGSYTPLDLGGEPVGGAALDETIGAAAAALRRRFDAWHARIALAP